MRRAVTIIWNVALLALPFLVSAGVFNLLRLPGSSPWSIQCFVAMLSGAWFADAARDGRRPSVYGVGFWLTLSIPAIFFFLARIVPSLDEGGDSLKRMIVALALAPMLYFTYLQLGPSLNIIRPPLLVTHEEAKKSSGNPSAK